MLEEVLHIVDLEQLFSILSRWLLRQHQDLPMGNGQTHELSPFHAPPATLNDQDLIRQLLPELLRRELRKKGLIGLHLMSFAIRHRVTQLSLIFHHLARPERLAGDPVWKEFCQKADLDAERLDYFTGNWAGFFRQDYIPVWGFSALGIHASIRSLRSCRGFDAFDLEYCSEACSEIFCDHHKNEAFWFPGVKGTRQSVMFDFYVNKNNAELYSEEELRELTRSYLESISVFEKSSAESFVKALVQFEYDDAADLLNSTGRELRRRFLQLSMHLHPDHGGNNEDFIQLQANYYCLKIYLQRAS